MEEHQSVHSTFLFCVIGTAFLHGFFALQLVESYKMENNPHGYCVILNNYRFKNPNETRKGTVEDGSAYFFNPVTSLFFFITL